MAGLARAALGVAVVATPARPDSVNDIRPAVTSAIAPRGGVMMLPLIAGRPGDNWPRTMEVKLEDGSKLAGDVAWVSAVNALAAETGWTDDPRHLAIRAVDRGDDDSQAIDRAAGEGPYLLVRLPEDGRGTMTIAGRAFEAAWRDVPWQDPLRDDNAPIPDQAMTIASAPDRPDPDSPFEYWRWVLLADRLGLNPPAPVGEEIQRMAAEHLAILWRIGLARIARISKPVASETRAALTSVALDRGRPMATWVSDPRQVASLLGVLIESRRDEDALSGAVAWLDQQPKHLLWPEDESGDRVQLAMTPTGASALDVQFTWQGSGQAPSSLRVEPGVVAHVSIERLPMQSPPALMEAEPVEPANQTLLIDAGSQSAQIACGPRVTAARPPGVGFRPLHPPLMLADVRFNRTPQPSPERATLVQVRRLGGRWEVFVECRRVIEKRQTIDPGAIRTVDDLRGVEAFTLLLGDADAAGGPAIWLTIPEHEWPIVVRGENDPDLQVHRRSFADRWHCRIVLPDKWFSAAETKPAFTGFIRSHGDRRDLDTGPAASPPWRVQPGRVALDLSHWDDLPQPEQ